ncbi:hypothetical protein PMAYCL1PPCAC_05121, partial [Pristionchus mayeri]
LSLINLPSDVIRNIVKVGLEDVDTMKQISPRWNSRASEHLNTSKNLPIINYCCLNLDERRLYIRFPERFRKYFGAEKWRVIQHTQDVWSDKEFAKIVSDGRFDSFAKQFRRCGRIHKLQLEIDIIKHADK